MSFNVKDGHGAQALDLNSLLAQLQGAGVIAGGTVSSAAGAFVVELEATAVYLNGTRHDLAAQTLDLAPYLDTESGNPRKAVLYVDTNGDLVVAPGDPATKQPSEQHRFQTYRPAPPDLRHTDAVPLVEVWLNPADTQLTDADLQSRKLTADLSAHAIDADTGDFNEIIDGAGVSHTGELADSSAVNTDADIREAINTDTDHGSTAAHNYFSGSHTDLSGVTTEQHHPRYTDSEAREAVRGSVDAAALTGASGAAEQHLVNTGTDIVWDDPPAQQADPIASGTITHTGGSSTSVRLAGVAADQTAEFEVSVGVSADPSWDANYAFSVAVSRHWDDTNSALDVDLTLTWDTDPGSGNDLSLDWTAWDAVPVSVTGRYTDTDAVNAMTNADISPSSVHVETELLGPVYDDLTNYPTPEQGDIAIASGANASWSFGQYLHNGTSWEGPLGTSVTALSGLSIDTAKDWNGYAITNVGAPTANTDGARQQELNDHTATSNAHHAQTTSGDIDHGLISNVQSKQHHARYTDQEAVEATAGRRFSASLTGSSIPAGEALRGYRRVDTGETLTLVRGEAMDRDGTVPSGLTLQLYDRTAGTVVYEQSSKLATGSPNSPLATVSGGADIEIRIVNSTGQQVSASGLVNYYLS